MKSRTASVLAAALVSALLLTAPISSAVAVGTGGVTGTVTRTNGTALVGVTVSVQQLVSGSLSTVATTTTNGSGAFSFTALDPGSYTVKYDPKPSNPAYLAEWWGGSYASANASFFTVANGASSQRSAVLEFGAAVHGTVSGAGVGGTVPLSGVSVRLYDTAQNLVFSTTTDDSGNYRFEGMNTATYVMRFLPAGGTYASEWYPQSASFGRAQQTTFTAGFDVTQNAVLPLASSFSGTMKDKNNNNLTGYVVVYDASGSASSASNLVVTSVPVSGGSFTAYGLVPGQYRLAFTTASLPGYGPTGPAPSVLGYITEWWNSGYSVNTATLAPVANGGGIAYTGFDAVLENPVFADVQDPTSPFYESIEWMYAQNISTGTTQPSGKPLYKPTDSVSRQSMALFLYRLSGASFTPPVTPTFADVPSGASTYTAIEWMASEGISLGTAQPSGKPLFNPTAIVSRQSMAVFLARLAEVDTNAPTTNQVFADVPVSASTATAIEWMYNTGITTGTAQPSGLPLYKPTDPVSRQSMALFLYRFAHNI